MKNGSLLNVPLIAIFRNERDVHQSLQDLPLQVRQLCNNFSSDILRTILAFNIKSDAKQDCILASNLFGILPSSETCFTNSIKGGYNMHTRLDSS